MRVGTWLGIVVLAFSVPLYATDYLTEGADPGRTGWLKAEKAFSTENVKSMKLLWKVKLDSQPRQMHNVFPPLIGERVMTPRGPREMAIVAGVSDDLFGIDVASGEVVWTKRYASAYTPSPTAVYHTLCLGGQTAMPAMEQIAPGVYTVYAIGWDGRLQQINAADGSDAAPPERFMPPNGKPYALNVVDGVVYTATAQGCGGVPNAFYSFHLATRKAGTFHPAGGGMWGRRGAAVSPEGVVYMVTGDAMYNPTARSLGNAIVGVRIDANQQLQLVDWFAPPNANWMRARDLDLNVTPMAFDHRGRKFLVGTSKECRLWLLDRDALGGDDHRTALHTTSLLCNDDQAFDAKGVWGAMATWQDPQGVQWVSCPSGDRSAVHSVRRPSMAGRRWAALRRTSWSRPTEANGGSIPDGSHGTWTWPRKCSSPTALCSPTRRARTRHRRFPTSPGMKRTGRSSGARSTRTPNGVFRIRVTRPSMPSMAERVASSGRAVVRLRRGITGVA